MPSAFFYPGVHGVPPCSAFFGKNIKPLLTSKGIAGIRRPNSIDSVHCHDAPSFTQVVHYTKEIFLLAAVGPFTASTSLCGSPVFLPCLVRLTCSSRSVMTEKAQKSARMQPKKMYLLLFFFCFIVTTLNLLLASPPFWVPGATKLLS